VAFANRAGAVSRHGRFQGRPCRGADESAGFVSEELGNLGGVVSPRRLAGDDHGAGVDLFPRQTGFLEGGIDQLPQGLRLNIPIAGEGRQYFSMHRNLVELLEKKLGAASHQLEMT
jgi:hypothetical protein